MTFNKQGELKEHYDIVIIGTGAGGGTLAYALRESNKKILLIERGDFLPQEDENSSPKAVFIDKRYQFTEGWKNLCDNQKIGDWSNIYWVGGKTKVYGASLMRLRKEDFGVIHYREGVSPSWPIQYDDLEPYYSAAEQLYSVHGNFKEDPTEPPHSSPYPFPQLPYDSYIKYLLEKLREQGLHPSPIPIGVLESERNNIDFKSFDGYPSKTLGKADSDICCIRPALKYKNITLLTNTFANRLITDPTGNTVVGVEVIKNGTKSFISGGTFIVACGALHSPALLLRSKSQQHQQGLANSSNLVGKNLMCHTNTIIIACHLLRKNTSNFQKAFNIMDFYQQRSESPYPAGVIQMIGQMPLDCFVPRGVKWLAKMIKNRSIQLLALSEDLPNLENSISLSTEKTIQVFFKPNNLEVNQALVTSIKKNIKSIFSLVVTKPFIGEFIPFGHACGTVCFGNNPRNSVLDQFCRTHDVSNLFVVDSSFFPSSGAVNPALTVMAQALRVADHLMKRKSINGRIT